MNTVEENQRKKELFTLVSVFIAHSEVQQQPVMTNTKHKHHKQDKVATARGQTSYFYQVRQHNDFNPLKEEQKVAFLMALLSLEKRVFFM